MTAGLHLVHGERICPKLQQLPHALAAGPVREGEVKRGVPVLRAGRREPREGSAELRTLCCADEDNLQRMAE